MSAAAHLTDTLDGTPSSPEVPASGDTLDRHSSGWSTAARGESPTDSALPAMVSGLPEVSTGVREGEVVADKYRIGKRLGSGAMGTVFAAHHLLLDQRVAIKFLVPEALGHADAVARFLREARAAVLIKSKHVVRVLDVALLEGGAPYIVMEHLQGCDLAAWLHTHGRLEADAAVDFILQACDAIDEAHGLGIIHRDVKPANLFAVQSRGVVESIKVLDFGISKAADLVSSTLAPSECRRGAVITEERTPIGSPCYMSPEQMESARDVDRRTDIWALGATLCELVTGHLPFEGQSLVQVYSRIKSGAPLRLRDGSPHLPRGLEAVILRCLATDRERRYPNVGELGAALVPFGSSRAAGYLRRLGRGENASQAGAIENPRHVTPSPRAPVAHGGNRTQVSAGSFRPGTERSPNVRAALVVGFIAALLVAAAAWTVFLKSRVVNQTHALDPVASRVRPSPAAQVPSPAADPSAAALAPEREPVANAPLATRTDLAPPDRANEAHRSPQPSSAPGLVPRSRANAQASSPPTGTSARAAGNGSPDSRTPWSTSAVPSSSAPDWFPPDVQK